MPLRLARSPPPVSVRQDRRLMSHVGDKGQGAGWPAWHSDREIGLTVVNRCVLEQLVDRGDVALSVASCACLGEDLVGNRGRGQARVELGGGLTSEANVLVHQLDAEPCLVGSI